MRAIVRTGLAALAVVGCVEAALAQGTATKNAAPPANARPAAPPTAVAAPKPPADLGNVLATVNGEPITKGDVLGFLSKYELPPTSREQIYNDAVNSIANTRLVIQYLNRQRVPVSEQKVDQEIENLKKQLASDGTDLPTEMLRTGLSMDALRKEFGNRIRLVDFINARATDAELKRFAATHKDLFSNTQIKASHILLSLDGKSSAADKEALRQKLAGIKKEIESNKISFADAANKYSQDPANAEGGGGDLGYFGMNSGFIEEFANKAFSMKKGEISDPVETPYGFHLIQVTDRKEGTPLDFEANKPLVKQFYAAEVQKGILAAERKAAKIDIKPMPADLFPPAPAQAPATAPAAAPATAPPARPGTPK